MLGFIERPREILRAAYEVIGCRGAPSSKAEEGLERGHGLPPAIVAKDEFIEVNLELTAAHAVIGSNEPLPPYVRIDVASGNKGKRGEREG